MAWWRSFACAGEIAANFPQALKMTILLEKAGFRIGRLLKNKPCSRVIFLRRTRICY